MGLGSLYVTVAMRLGTTISRLGTLSSRPAYPILSCRAQAPGAPAACLFPRPASCAAFHYGGGVDLAEIPGAAGMSRRLPSRSATSDFTKALQASSSRLASSTDVHLMAAVH